MITNYLLTLGTVVGGLQELRKTVCAIISAPTRTRKLRLAHTMPRLLSCSGSLHTPTFNPILAWGVEAPRAGFLERKLV